MIHRWTDWRSATREDAVISGRFGQILVEAETHLGGIQAIERRLGGKARDLGVERAILLVADTRHNHRVLASHPEFRERFPIATRPCLKALTAGADTGGDCLVIL